MNNNLFMKLADYRILNELIKTNKSSLKSILIRSELRNLKKSIASTIDDDILTFKELYKLLKVLEKRSFGKIHFQACRLCYEDSIFEDESVIDGIRIFKETEDKNDIIDILFDDYLFDPIRNNVTNCYEISPEDLSMPSVSIILLKMKLLYESEYNKLINLIISYLIKREKI